MQEKELKQPRRSLFTGLWRHPDFLKLWAGQTVSSLGSMITRDGLPLLAVINLGATPFQMGVLNAVSSAPVIIIGLFAGVWVDRLRRRPILISADLGRALLLATIPLAALTGWLSMAQLYVIAALTGILAVFFSVAYVAYLPTLVERENIVEGNSKLAFTDSVTEIAGSGITGVLVQLITAPFAILIDAISFVVSALSLSFIRKPEPPPAPAETRQNALHEARDGLKAVIHNPVLRSLTAVSGTMSFFGNFFGALYGLFAIRELGLSPAALGLTIAVGGIGSLFGALLAVPAVRRFGLGRTLIAVLALEAMFTLTIPLAGAFPRYAMLLLMVGQTGDLLGTIYAINAVSLRQAITPNRLLGRVNSSMELLAAGIGPLGALTGGLLGGLIGIQNTLTIAILGRLLGSLWLLLSPVRRLKAFPAEVDGD